MTPEAGPDEQAATLELLARQLTDAPPTAAPLLPPGTDPRALAWALKSLCYAAWHGEPPRAARAAEWLQALADAAPPGDERLAAELHGLARWTAGIAALTRSQLAEAVSDFDAAAAALRRADCADAAAQTQVPKIMALSLLGHRAEAATCADAAQRELRALGNLPVAARVILNLGNLQLLRAAHADAARQFREAAVLFARLGDRTHSVLADIGLAEALAAMGDFDEAQRIVARARMRADHPGLGLQQALAEESAALLALVRGRYQEALSGLEAARRRYAALGMPQYLAVGEKQLADAYLELRLLPEAWRLLDDAVTRFAALALPDEQAGALAQRGRAEALLGRSGAADASFAAAAALFSGLGHGVGAASVALARAELALAAQPGPPSALHEPAPARTETEITAAGASAALAWADQAAAGFAAASLADGQARAAVIRARALLAGGHAEQATQVFAAALATARERGQTQIQVRCLTGQGLAALALGRPEAAVMAFDAAIELAEDQRRLLPGDEIRCAFLTDQLRPYQERLRLALAAGDPAQVLWQLDRLRARSLDESPADDLPAGAGTEVDDETLTLRERLNWLYRRVQRVQDEGGSDEPLQAELRRVERDLLERARRQRLAAGRPSSLPAPPGLDVAALQATLQPGDALVAYGVLDDEMFACVVTPGGTRLCRNLAGWGAVQEALRGVRFQLDTLRHGAVPVQRHLDMLARRLAVRLAQAHALVWAPLLAAAGAALAQAQRLLVVPHGALGALPFAALAPLDAAPLAERHALALAPSARAAWRCLQQQRAAATSAAAGGLAATGSAPGASPAAPRLRRVLALGESSRLPQAAAEARAVAALHPQARVLVDEAATPQALRASAAGVDLLHLACHAQFRGDNPRFSALHLHGAALTADEAETLPLAAGPLVVLSACETALAEAGPVDEMVGLVRAFLRAGATQVLASLWPVDDAVTAQFMAGFHGALAAGQPPAAALRQAQAALRLAFPHPFFWASFTLYGGW